MTGDTSDHQKDLENMSDYVFVKYDDNWADEFDVESVWIGPRSLWEKMKADILKYITGEREIYFGTNEAITIDSGAAVINNCKVSDIDAEDAQTVVRWMDPSGRVQKGVGLGLIDVIGRLHEQAIEARDEGKL